jgi:hypothetical protein
MIEQSQTKEQILVTMQNGEVKNFGVNGRLLSSERITDEGIEITFHIVDGTQVTFCHYVKGLDEFTAQALAFGFATKVKASTAGVPVVDIKAVIETKLEEFAAGIWVTRGSNGESLTPLTQLQTAYANANGINVSASDGVAKVNAIFAAMTKEAKQALYREKAIKIEIAKLKLAAAEAM